MHICHNFQLSSSNQHSPATRDVIQKRIIKHLIIIFYFKDGLLLMRLSQYESLQCEIMVKIKSPLP